MNSMGLGDGLLVPLELIAFGAMDAHFPIIGFEAIYGNFPVEFIFRHVRAMNANFPYEFIGFGVEPWIAIVLMNS